MFFFHWRSSNLIGDIGYLNSLNLPFNCKHIQYQTLIFTTKEYLYIVAYVIKKGMNIIDDF